MKHYTISQDKGGAWYAHMVGYPWIPVFGSFGSRQKATQCAADNMALTLEQYRDYKRRKPQNFK